MRSVPSLLSALLLTLLSTPPLRAATVAYIPQVRMEPAGLPQSPAAPQVSYAYELPPESRGDLDMVHGQYAAALNAYQHAQLTRSVVWLKIGVAYHHLFAMDEALKAYRVALRLDPHSADALNNIGAVYHARHNYREAEKYYGKALKYRPHSAVIYCNLGTTYFADGRYKKAERAYNHAFALDPAAFSHQDYAAIDEGGTREQRIAQDYYLARAFARAGLQKQAMLYLQRAIDAGFHDRRRLDGEQDFATLRTTPEFKQLLAAQKLE